MALVYSVLILNDNQKYAMKFNFGVSDAVRGEYDFLVQLQSFANWSNISLNVPWIHPTIPPLVYIKTDAKNEKRRLRCFILLNN